jgi:hypothetical protein
MRPRRTGQRADRKLAPAVQARRRLHVPDKTGRAAAAGAGLASRLPRRTARAVRARAARIRGSRIRGHRSPRVAVDGEASASLRAAGMRPLVVAKGTTARLGPAHRRAAGRNRCGLRRRLCMSGRARRAITRPDRRRATARPDRLPVIAPRGLRAAAVAAAAHRAAVDILAGVAASPSFLQDRKASVLPIGPVPFSVGRAVFLGGATE